MDSTYYKEESERRQAMYTNIDGFTLSSRDSTPTEGYSSTTTVPDSISSLADLSLLYKFFIQSISCADQSPLLVPFLL